MKFAFIVWYRQTVLIFVRKFSIHWYIKEDSDNCWTVILHNWHITHKQSNGWFLYCNNSIVIFVCCKSSANKTKYCCVCCTLHVYNTPLMFVWMMHLLCLLLEPLDQPDNFKLINSTLTSNSADFTWDPVDQSEERIRGFFRGYQVVTTLLVFMYGARWKLI